MDIQVETALMLDFLNKISLGGLIKDAIVNANNGRLSCRLTDASNTMYCEVYESRVKITEDGAISIPSLKSVIAMIKRSDSDMIRIKSNNTLFCISDGNKIGKFKADLLQATDPSYIESSKGLREKVVFEKETLTYNPLNEEYKNGFQVNKGILDVILKDAKAFGYELYKVIQKNDKIIAIIENSMTGEKFQRTISEEKPFLPEVPLAETIVGIGFRNMVDSLPDSKQLINVFVHKDSWLLTDKDTFYYNLHTVQE